MPAWKRTFRFLIAGAVLGLLVPSTAHAYIDPGILASLYQALYVLIFGAITAYIVRPWRYVKSLFRKSAETAAEDESPASREAAQRLADRPDGDDRS